MNLWIKEMYKENSFEGFTRNSWMSSLEMNSFEWTSALTNSYISSIFSKKENEIECSSQKLISDD